MEVNTKPRNRVYIQCLQQQWLSSVYIWDGSNDSCFSLGPSFSENKRDLVGTKA